MAMGGNFLSATPDTSYTAEALRKTEMVVHVSTKLNRSHLVVGDESIILPCYGRTDIDKQADGEQFVTVENSMGVVHPSRGKLTPISDKLKSEPEIVCDLALVMDKVKDLVDWKNLPNNYDRIRELIEKTLPGFENYNTRVRKPGGFYLPNGARIGEYKTDTGKANFTVNDCAPLQLEKDELAMMTIRSHDQFNTTIYGLDDRYRGIYNERRIIMMNKKDISRFQLKAGDVVNIYNYTDNIKRIAPHFIVVEYDIPVNCTSTYFPETNVLVPISSVADKSNTPVSKLVIIKIEKCPNH
jgi:anaerobic selenocysteine-containing dehydrogenase